MNDKVALVTGASAGSGKATALKFAQRGYRTVICDLVIALHPLGRLGKSKEVANAVVWLASDESSFVTGHALLVDGG